LTILCTPTNKKDAPKMKTIELLDKLKAAYGLTSDYAAAKKMGITTQAISRHRNKLSTFDDKASFEIAELLELDPAQVVASMNLERAERSQNEKLISFWSQYAH
jgi:hypothetical protein